MVYKELDLTPDEWRIMQTIWDEESKTTVRRILSKAYHKNEQDYESVQKTMNRLVNKSILKCEKVGNVSLYYAAVSRERVLNQAFMKMADLMFQGSLSGMASYLVNAIPLAPDELKGMQHILNSKKD